MDSISNLEEPDLEQTTKSKTFDNRADGRVPGTLAYLKLDDKEMDLVIDYLRGAYPQSYPELIYCMLGSKLMMYYDVFEGLTVRIPTRKVMVRVISYIRIYKYLKERNFTNEAYEKASKIYRKRVPALHRIVEKVEGRLILEEEND